MVRIKIAKKYGSVWTVLLPKLKDYRKKIVTEDNNNSK